MSEGARLTLRAATMEDGDLLFRWANDLLARQNSFDQRPIALAEHLAWLRHRLSEEGTRIYVAALDDTPCGVVRFEPRDQAGSEVSVTLDPDFRGRGLSARIIRSGTERYRSEVATSRILALVKDGNVASIRAFERAGYRRAGSDRGITRLEIV